MSAPAETSRAEEENTSGSEGEEHNSEHSTTPSSARSPASPSPPPQPTSHSLRATLHHTWTHIQTNPQFTHATGSARIALLSLFLGATFASGVHWALFSPALRQFGLYLACMAFFHTMEFIWQAIFHPSKLSATSFLLNHSREYHLALFAGVAEYVIESFLFPSLKFPSLQWAMWLGLFVTVCGQLARTLAMFTAAANFTHMVAEWKQPNHKLVTHGIYSLCRHPSYAGWFWWSVGTQLLLCNPLCMCAYAYVSYRFFRERIHWEERAMLGFFGDEYRRYQQRVPSGVPLVKGFGQ